MAISDGHKANFETLRRAMRNDAAAIVECRDQRTGKVGVYIVAMNRDQTSGEIDMAPFALMLEVEDLNNLQPPNPDGGFFPATTWEPE